jgi:hypothetical protein
MGLVADIAAGVLRGAGQDDLADWVKNAPGKLGEELGKIFHEGLKSDGSFTSDALTKLKKLRDTDSSQTPPPPPDLLSEYVADLNGLAARASSLQAVAVRGFFHSTDCLALWHFIEQRHPSFKVERDVTGGPPTVWVYNSGIDIYIGPTVDDAHLYQFNLALEKDHTSALRDIEERCESKVKSLTKNAVTLTPLRARGHRGDDADVEIENSGGVAEAFRTMDLAINTQNERLRKYQESRKNR